MKIFSLLSCLTVLMLVHGAGAAESAATDLVPADELEQSIGDLPYPGANNAQEPPFECVAQNAAGDNFSVRGFRPLRVQERALNDCLEVSRYCRRLGCHHVVYPR
jgi:hypothetical protein